MIQVLIWSLLAKLNVSRMVYDNLSLWSYRLTISKSRVWIFRSNLPDAKGTLKQGHDTGTKYECTEDFTDNSGFIDDTHRLTQHERYSNCRSEHCKEMLKHVGGGTYQPPRCDMEILKGGKESIGPLNNDFGPRNPWMKIMHRGLPNQECTLFYICIFGRF